MSEKPNTIKNIFGNLESYFDEQLTAVNKKTEEIDGEIKKKLEKTTQLANDQLEKLNQKIGSVDTLINDKVTEQTKTLLSRLEALESQNRDIKILYEAQAKTMQKDMEAMKAGQEAIKSSVEAILKKTELNGRDIEKTTEKFKAIGSILK